MMTTKTIKCPRCGGNVVFIEPDDSGRSGRMECVNRCFTVPYMYSKQKAIRRWEQEVTKWKNAKGSM